jgi:hypothetical protein
MYSLKQWQVEQSTPHLLMACHHAMQARDKFGMLLHDIKEKLPDTNVCVAPLELSYRALEKMALEDSDGTLCDGPGARCHRLPQHRRYDQGITIF